MRGAQAAFVGMILDGGFALASIFRGPHWRLSGEEKLIAGTHVNNVALSVLPPEYLDAYNGILEKFGPVLGALLPVTAIIGKRLAIDRAIAAQEGVGGDRKADVGGYANASKSPDQSSGVDSVVSEPVNGRTNHWGNEEFSW